MHLNARNIVSAVALFVTVATAACSGPSAPTPLTGSASASGEAPVVAKVTGGQSTSTRPMSGSCTTTFGAPLSPPPIIRQVDTGDCQFSHLGRTAIYLLQDIDVVNGTQVSVELTFTAADGDVLRASNVGTNARTGPTSSSFTSTLTVTGGTGRFTNATGQWHLAGTVDVSASTATFSVVDGWITY